MTIPVFGGTQTPFGLQAYALPKIPPTVTSDNPYTASYGEVIEYGASGGEIDLPTAVGSAGEMIAIKAVGASGCTIDPTGAETIDDQHPYTLDQYQSVTLLSDGTNWLALGDLGAAAASHTHATEIHFPVTDPTGDDLSTGDGQGPYFRVPAALNGWNVTAVAASLSTASTSGAVTVQVRNGASGNNILSTAITIDQDETDTLTAATPAVINTDEDELATGDLIWIDIDGAGTGAKGLTVTLTVAAP